MKSTTKYEDAVFHLQDIPEEWQIELQQEFVNHLDRTNRPWKYNKSLKRPYRAVFCRAGETRLKYVKDYEQYRLEVSLFEQLWGRHRWKDYHFKADDPRRYTDTGNWIRKYHLQVIKKLGYSNSKLEKHIIGLRRGPSSQKIHRYLHFQKLPITPNESWAWLIGFYYSGGSVYLRDRYYKEEGIDFRIRVHNPVIPLVEEITRKIGSTAFSFQPKDAPLKTDTGLGTTRRAYITLSWPVFLVMQKMGLKYYEPSGNSARSYKPVIPTWIKQNSSMMQAFIEAFLNGARGRSWLYPSNFDGKIKPRMHIILEMAGTPEQYVKQFLIDINSWFTKQGYTGFLRQIPYINKDPSRVLYRLIFYRKKTADFFLTNFRIRRPDIRARLLIMQKASKDNLIHEILCTIRSPHNVILGMLIEQPLSEQEVCYKLQMRAKGVKRTLKELNKWGLIIYDEGKYHYKPETFKQSQVDGVLRPVTSRELSFLKKKEVNHL